MNFWAIPGIKKGKNDVFLAAEDFRKHVERHFNLPEGFFNLQKSVRKPWKPNGVDIYSIRQAMVYLMANSPSNPSLREIAAVVGLRNHTSAMHCRNKATHYLNTGDERFMLVYAQVERIAENIHQLAF